MSISCNDSRARGIFVGAMDKAVVIKGRLTGPRSVELETAVNSAAPEVEVVVHPLPANPPANGETISQFIRRLPPGTLTKQQIDSQVQDERASWGER
jgi:hypothetical protein